jgi:hypothetical protein
MSPLGAARQVQQLHMNLTTTVLTQVNTAGWRAAIRCLRNTQWVLAYKGARGLVNNRCPGAAWHGKPYRARGLVHPWLSPPEES